MSMTPISRAMAMWRRFRSATMVLISPCGGGAEKIKGASADAPQERKLNPEWFA